MTKRFLLLLTLLAGCAAPHPTADLLDGARDTETLVATLRAGNEHFVSGGDPVVLTERPELATGQSPPVAVLCCADSRVAPEQVFAQRPGRLFVVREAGNVPDTHGIASLEYAVAKLDTSVIVVLGHTTCGAVTAAASGKDPGTPALRALVAAIEPAVAAQHGHAHDHDLVERAIVENVRRSQSALLAQSSLLSDAVASGRLTVVGAVHDLATGRVRFLDEE